MRFDQLRGLRVGLAGFGREGRAFERAATVRVPDLQVSVLDEQKPAQAPERWPLHTGVLTAHVADLDVVLRSPGIPVDHPALEAVRRRGGRVEGLSSIWFAERPEARVVAVTGSKGKSTTAALIAHLMRAAGLEAVLAGNIGVPLLDHLDTNADWFVVELSSYQLADLTGRPTLGVITRLFPEHADWHGSTSAYYACKLRLLDLLDGNPLFVNAADPVLSSATAAYSGRFDANTAAGLHARTQGLFREDQRLLEPTAFRLPGRHNLDNTALALTVLEHLDHRAEDLLPALSDFAGLPHRLEAVPTGDGRVWINDSIATTPHATRAALSAFPARPVVLIAGGLERNGDWNPVLEWCRTRPLAGLISLPDNGLRVAAALEGGGAVASARSVAAGDMAQAVRSAARLADAGAVILLSPGAPSFPHFRDFEDRGEQFRRAVGRAFGPGRSE